MEASIRTGSNLDILLKYLIKLKYLQKNRFLLIIVIFHDTILTSYFCPNSKAVQLEFLSLPNCASLERISLQFIQKYVRHLPVAKGCPCHEERINEANEAKESAQFSLVGV